MNLVINVVGNQIIALNTPQQTIVMSILVKVGVSLEIVSIIILFL